MPAPPSVGQPKRSIQRHNDVNKAYLLLVAGYWWIAAGLFGTGGRVP